LHVSNELISGIIAPLTEKWVNENLISHWFFIRYGDPENHLRVRFCVKNNQKIGDLLNEFKNKILPYMENRRVWKIQVDTYNREIERYGLNTIELAEKLFWQDAIEQIEDEKLYVLFVTKSVDRWLSLFDFSLEQKSLFAEISANSFKSEFNTDKKLLKQLNVKYGSLREDLKQFISSEEISFLEKLLDKRDQHCGEDVTKALKELKNDENGMTTNNFLGSIVHMTINRAFTSKQRFYELVIFDMLSRYYKACIFTSKKNLH
jgi:thiopeptide-type bacteriocin biosynthesis protein